MSEWQPIETSPKDETWIILFFPSGVGSMTPDVNDKYKIGFWSTEYADWFDWEGAGNSLTSFGDHPTHWMPLPAPPVP